MLIDCECSSYCGSTIHLSPTEYANILSAGLVVIVDSCPTGPSPTDTLVEQRTGYSLYQP
jgi:hypothetical protein